MVSMSDTPDILDLNPKIADFKSETLKTLSQERKAIKPKFFYDDRGSRLFDEITRLQEYYPTRSELSILDGKCSEISQFIGPGATVVELGGGNGMKGSKLLSCLEEPESYILVDISRDSLEMAVRLLRSEHSNVRVRAVWADYTEPEVMRNLDFPGTKSIVFLGSTIGNMEPENAVKFLDGCRKILKSGESLTVGVDLKKDRSVLENAYNDSKGVTALFNLNLINRINNEFGTSINPSSFSHRAFYNEKMGRIEMHLVSLVDQEFILDGVRIRIKKGETIHTENSYKYSIDEFITTLKGLGFSHVVHWTDPNRNYALFSARI